MPTTTKGWPYPAGGAPIGNGDLDVKALADALDKKLQHGSHVFGSAASGVVSSQVINFAPAFDTIPDVAFGANSPNVVVRYSALSAAAMTIEVTRSATTGPTVRWIATA